MTTARVGTGTVQEGEWVVSKQVSGHLRIVKAGIGGSIKMKKRLVSTANFTGHTYGSVFDVVPIADSEDTEEAKAVRAEIAGLTQGSKKRKLKQIQVCKMVKRKDDEPSEYSGEVSGNVAPGSVTEDNRNLVDDGTSQKLTEAQINELTSNAAAGDEVVKAIVENSDTYQGKTAFSKEKYLKQKKKKFVYRSRVLRATARTLAENYWEKSDPPGRRMGGVRWADTIPQILAYANVHAGARVLSFDSWGVVNGAVVERLGGYGKLYAAHADNRVMLGLVKFFNFSENVISTVSTCALECMLGKEPIKAKHVERMPSLGECDSLIITTEYEPMEMLKVLWCYLAPSRPFVVHAESIDALTRCKSYIESQAIGVRVKLTESWFSEMQVLPSRTHPHMIKSATGGYLLSGYKVLRE